MTDKSTRAPAEEIRDAASRLREAAKGTTPVDGDPYGWLGNVNEDSGHAFIFGGPTKDGYRTGTVFQFKDEMDCEECSRPSPADLRWMWTSHPGLAKPLADLLDEVADRWDTEVESEVLECPRCGEASGCDHPAEADFHTDGCEQILAEITDDNRYADWRCDCFDNALRLALAINGGEPGA